MKEKVQKIIKQFYEEDNYTIPIAIALTIAFILLIYSYIAFMKPNEFVSFSVLDEQKEAKNYPELLVIGENNTCKLWIVVENHMEKSISCKVLLKITDQPIQFIPLQMEENRSYNAVLNKGERWEKQVEISFNDTGDFHLVFELWIYDEKTGGFEFSNNFCVLSLKVIEA
ncbi:MAG: DUF1616 domain-containing protein [Candidatus Bathyarchaeia archaeon]